MANSADADEVAEKLAELEGRVAALEASLGEREAAADRARRSLAELRRQRRRGGTRTWEGAQRGALRFVVLSAGCIAMVTGGWALDSTVGGVTIVASFGVLMFEGLR